MKFRRRPFVVEAVRWTGANLADINELVTATNYWRDGTLLVLRSSDSTEPASPGDWVVRLQDGRLEVCTAAEFETAYESIPPSALPWVETATKKRPPVTPPPDPKAPIEGACKMLELRPSEAQSGDAQRAWEAYDQQKKDRDDQVRAVNRLRDVLTRIRGEVETALGHRPWSLHAGDEVRRPVNHGDQVGIVIEIRDTNMLPYVVRWPDGTLTAYKLAELERV